MSSLNGSIPAWTYASQGTRPSYSIAPDSGTPAMSVCYVYFRSETEDWSNMQPTWGTESPTIREFSKAGNVNVVFCTWDEVATAARTNDNVVWSGNSTPGGFYITYFIDGTKDGAPHLSFANNILNPGTDPQSVSLTGAASGKFQVVLWGHLGTDNRVFTGDAAWSGNTSVEFLSPPASTESEFGSAYSSGGLTTYELDPNTDDGFVTFVLGVQYDDPAPAGMTITSVNGDDIVRRHMDDDDGEDNRAIAFVTKATTPGVTSVELESIVQGIPEITDLGDGNWSIAFDISMDGSPDLTYGSGKTLTLKGDAGGDKSRTVQLLPPEDSSYLTVSGYPPAGDAVSVLKVFNDADVASHYSFTAFLPADGDMLEYQSTTNIGHTVTMGADGVPIIGGGGNSPQYFTMRLRGANNANAWSTDQNDVAVFINYPATIESVDGVTGNSGKIDLNATSIKFEGEQFGVELGDAELWAMPGKDTDLDTAVGVQQNPLGTEITGFSERGFTLSAFDDGGGVILNGSDVTFWFIPGNTI